MNGFIAATAILTLLVIAWMVRALLRPAAQSDVSSQKLNTEIYRDQLASLDRDLARGAISPADFETTQDELKLRLLDDTAQAPSAPRSPGFLTKRRMAIVVALVIPMGAASMYGWLGNPAAIDPIATQTANNTKVLQMVETLAARLKTNPDNPKGWAMLARSYKVMGRLEEAEQAFDKAGDFINTDADLLVDYADLLATRNNEVEGKPLQLINQALQIAPQHPTALMMSGIAAYRRTDYALAVAQWEKLLLILEPGSEDALQVEANIAQARAKTGKTTTKNKPPPPDSGATAPMSQEKINQMVDRLAQRLKTTPDDLAGWARLARAYKVQGRLAESEDAYTKASKLVDSDPDLLTQFADLLAMRSANNLEGRPLSLVNKALALNPKHPMALMMSASAAYRRADYAAAISQWEKVLTVLDPASSDATQIRAEIAVAQKKLDQGSGIR